MPNIKSAKKRVKVIATKTLRNKSCRYKGRHTRPAGVPVSNDH